MLRSASFFISMFLLASCGPGSRSNTDAGNNGDGGGGVDSGPVCNTSISGKVFAPNGTLPLYNVAVYLPATTPPPITEGVSCEQCVTGFPGGAVTGTFSDSSGQFRLEGIPRERVNNLPIVVATGKWRREITIPALIPCADNPIPDGTLRLPKNRTEGSMPRVAMVTGGCDPLACILSKLGIDASEFGSDSTGTQRVVFYDGVGGASPGTARTAPELWANINELRKFDLVINSCECSVHNENKTSPDVLRQYADMGGRVFSSHFHYTWGLSLVPQWANVAGWTTSAAGGTAPHLVETSHARGEALARWLVAVGASATYGQAPLTTLTNNVTTVTPPTQRWLYSSNQAVTHYLSFQTPVGVDPMQQCGKYVYAGMHVASGSVTETFPVGCSGGLSANEQTLIFLLFDLTSCVDIIQ